GVVVRRGPSSPELSATPSGSGSAYRITKPAAINEGETHWVLEAAEVGGVFYDIASTVVATSTVDDNDAPADYDENEASPEDGYNTPFPSVKFIASDGSRLGGFGVWESAAGVSMPPRPGTFYFTDPLDTSLTLRDDDERISNTTSVINRIAVSRNSNAED